jgi:hypothetical protein
MEKMVALFTLVVEGKVDYSSEVELAYVKARVKKHLDKQVKKMINEEYTELNADDEVIWRFIPCSTDFDEGGTIVRRLSDTINQGSTNANEY